MSVYFTKDHEWVAVDGDTGTIGVTAFAQGQLGDITFVELPGLGSELKQGDAAAVVDSVKAAADVYSPVSGTVSAVNGALEGAPELVNSDAEAGGWLFRLTLADPGELAALMDRAAYDAYLKGL